MPPNILINIALTSLSEIIIFKAPDTFSFEAPPPTSRKFAGEDPFSLITVSYTHLRAHET